MVKYIIYIFLIVATISCSKKAEFINVKLLNRKTSYTNISSLYADNNNSPKKKYLWGYEENVLIKREQNIQKLDSALIDYAKNRLYILDSLDYFYGGFSINFYQYTSVTKTFLEEKYYIPTFSGIEEHLVDQRNAYIGSVNYDRCEKDSTKWESSIRIKYDKKDADIKVKENEDPYYYRREVLESCY